jgi:hypothetical protein
LVCRVLLSPPGSLLPGELHGATNATRRPDQEPLLDHRHLAVGTTQVRIQHIYLTEIAGRHYCDLLVLQTHAS